MNPSEDELRRLREQINQVDSDLIRSINERAKLAMEVGKLKRAAGLPIYTPHREAEVLRRIATLNTGPISNKSLEAIYREIMSGSFALELPQRIGYLGPLHPTKEVIDDILYYHVSSIPFENLDILRGLTIRLDLASLEDQLVHKRRGGYCFQQNGLLLGVLRQIGFDVTPLSARIRLGLERDQTPPRTHLTLSVRIDGEDWICDAGAGGGSLTGIIRRHSSEEQMTRHEARRIVDEGGRFFHQMHSDGGWMDVYSTNTCECA
jgi:chorismate mutase-like protein